ncbi:MAG: tagatose 1,6-diphosphate aldolase [Devosia sp.]|nr:tagatose 1,6-diphosphate aldolase [Devosia sp.]
MKKMLNTIADAVDEMIAGYVAAYGSRVATHPGNSRIIVRAVPKARGKVALVIGNGSGHEPIAVGWVGEGLLDANAVGDIFSAPSPDLICAAVRAADRGAGVLLLISNHSGDVINGEAGADMARNLGHRVETLLMYDDISTAPRVDVDLRRGAPGTTFIYKLCGALSEEGASLADIKALGERVRDATVTLGASLTPGISPLTGAPMFTLPEGEVFIGVGVHGEPGMARMPAGRADDIVRFMAEKLIADLPFIRGDEAFAMVNGMGGTTMMELLVIYRAFAAVCAAHGVTIVEEPLIGSYVTAQEMGGFSLSLLRPDRDMKRLWRQPQDAPLFHHQQKASPAVASDKKRAMLDSLVKPFGFLGVLAIDQGSSLANMIVAAGAKGAAPDQLLFTFKSILVEEIAPEVSAVLLDYRFGNDLQKRVAPDVGILRAYELDVYATGGEERLTAMPLDGTVRGLLAAGAHGIKLYNYYDPDDSPETNAKKKALVERVGAECLANNAPFLFEPLVYSGRDDLAGAEFARKKPRLVTRVIEEFSKPEYHVDVLKVELPFNIAFVNGARSQTGSGCYSRHDARDFMRECAKASGPPLVFLSAGIAADAFREGLEIAAEAGIAYGGFVVGRAIWKDAIPIFAAEGDAGLRAWAHTEGRRRFASLVQAARPAARL